MDTRLRLYLPLLVGTAAGVAVWSIAYWGAHLSGVNPDAFLSLLIGTSLALFCYGMGILSPSRKEFALTPEFAEYAHLRLWLYYWVVVVILGFGFGAATTILLLGLSQGGPLVIGVGVPVTTIYFLVLLSRYSSRTFSHDVRSPLRALQTHITRMDDQSAVLNNLVGQLVEATRTLAGSVEMLVQLEKTSPVRKRKELEANLPHLWFRAYGTPPATVTLEIENRGEAGTIVGATIDSGYGEQATGGFPRAVKAGERVAIQIGQMSKRVKALQFKIACVVESSPPGKKVLQMSSFNCTQLKSGWGTPQGVEVLPAEPQDGMAGLG